MVGRSIGNRLTPLSDHTMLKVGTELFQLKGKDYLIDVDYTSKYFEVSVIPNTLALTVIQHTKSIFARFGIPKIVISDNGPQYSSREYKKFAKEWGFHHDTSSPKYPKSNGIVEKTVETVKRTIRKALKNGNDPCLALLALRSTPGVDNFPSPAFKLMNRHLRTPYHQLRLRKSHLLCLNQRKLNGITTCMQGIYRLLLTDNQCELEMVSRGE